jgi:hypothetical protein
VVATYPADVILCTTEAELNQQNPDGSLEITIKEGALVIGDDLQFPCWGMRFHLLAEATLDDMQYAAGSVLAVGPDADPSGLSDVVPPSAGTKTMLGQPLPGSWDYTGGMDWVQIGELTSSPIATAPDTTQTTSLGPTTADDGSTAEPTEGFTSYVDEDAGFSIAVPESWTVFPLTEQGLREGEVALGAYGPNVTEALRGYAVAFSGFLAVVDHRPAEPVPTGWITYGAVIRYDWVAADLESAAEDARGIHDEQQDLQIDIEPFEMAAGDGIKMTFTLVWGAITEDIIDYRIADETGGTWSIRFRTDRPDYYEDLTDAIARTFDLVD